MNATILRHERDSTKSDVVAPRLMSAGGDDRTSA